MTDLNEYDLTDSDSIQRAVSRIAVGVAANTIDLNHAGRLLQTLQIASAKLAPEGMPSQLTPHTVYSFRLTQPQGLLSL